MDITFTNCEKQLTHEDIVRVEKMLSVTFPDDFKTLYLKYNGGIPNKTLWYDENGELECLEINQFMTMLYVRPVYDNPDFTLENITKKEWSEGSLPLNLVLFAIDFGANYYCLDFKTGEIYYFVRDVWSDNLTHDQNLQLNSNLISSSFSKFIDELVEDEDEDEE